VPGRAACCAALVDVGPVTIRSLTRSQAERRQRVIDAAMTLAADGGYEAVQMRDVASTAGVALGTIYRYFTSKDHLLAAAMVEWSVDLEERGPDDSTNGSTPADRMVDVLRHVTSGMERRPRLAEALITAMTAKDAAVVECQREVTDTITRVLAIPIADLPAELSDGVVRVLVHVWHSVNLGWVNGWKSVGDIGDELEEAARLLLRDASAS